MTAVVDLNNEGDSQKHSPSASITPGNNISPSYNVEVAEIKENPSTEFDGGFGLDDSDSDIGDDTVSKV